MVDHDLRPVDEIPELASQMTKVKGRPRCNEFEAQDGVLAERAVENVEACLVLREVRRGGRRRSSRNRRTPVPLAGKSPGPLSWPLRPATGVLRETRLPKANASPNAQSMGPPA